MVENKIKISKFGILFLIVGILTIIISIIQWAIYYPDKSQLLTGIGGGLILFGFAYLHSWMKMVDKIHKKFEDDLEETNSAIDRVLDYARTIDDKIEKDISTELKGGKKK